MTHSGDWEYPLNSAVAPPPGAEAVRQPGTAEGRPGRPRRRQRAGRTDAAGGPALDDGGGKRPAPHGAAWPAPLRWARQGRGRPPRGPAASSPPRSRCWPCSPVGFLLDQALSIGWDEVAAAAVPRLRRHAARQHDAAGRRRRRSPARSSASPSPGWSSAPTCRAAASGRCSPRCRSPCPPSSPATAGSRSPRRCRASGAPPGSSPSPTTRSSTCRSRRCCAALDPALEESARSLGMGPWRTFFRVTLPQTRVALLGGMLLVSVHMLSEFGAFAMLRFQTFTTAIYDQYKLSFDGAAASMLASVPGPALPRAARRRARRRAGAGATRGSTRARRGRRRAARLGRARWAGRAAASWR